MSQQRKCSQPMQLAAKPSRRIVLPIDCNQYGDVIQDPSAFRASVDANFQQYPELFPDGISEGYRLHDMHSSRKLPEVRVRRIRLNRSGTVYQITPSFVLPYMTGYVETVEKALFLRRFGVPFWGLTHGFGRSDMYWYRVAEHLGRFDLVGTTVKTPEKLPEHLLADEKFTALNGQAVDVVLGAAVTLTMQTDELEEAYGEFKRETLRLNPTYIPKTLHLAGWRQTKAVWLQLFPTLIIIRCFLHAFLRIRDRCKNSAIYPRLQHLLWRIYHAKSQSNYYYHFG